MDSGITDLNSSEWLRRDGAIKVYTRKGKRKAAVLTAVDDQPQTFKSGDNGQTKGSVDVHEPSRRTLEPEGKELPKQPEEHPNDLLQVRAVPEPQSLTGDGPSGDEHLVVGEGQVGGNGPVNRTGEQDEVIRPHPVLQDDNHIGELPSANCVETKVVKPVICRVKDMVRINFSGARSVNEIRDLVKKVESELNQVRYIVRKLETTELQLAVHGNSVDVSNGGTISAVACDFGDPGHPQFSPSWEIKNRALMRGNSEVCSMGHQDFRRCRTPSISVSEINIGDDELVEKEKRTPKANQYYTNTEFLTGKDFLPPESNKSLKPNGAGKKHGGRGFSFSDGSYWHKNSKVFRNCSSLLQKLMNHTYGWVFNTPVNANALGLHDYHDIIKHPMDFGTIKTRLSRNMYKSPMEFAHDVRLVFRNAMTYNPKGQDVHIMAEQMSKIFEEKWVFIEAEYNPSWKLQVCHDSGFPVDTKMNSSFPCRTPFLKKPKANDLNKRNMTFEEKQMLGRSLQTLPPERLDGIVQIIKQRNPAHAQHNDEIEVDIDGVDAETLWELDRFVTNCKKNLSKNKKKAKTKQARAAQAALPTIPCPVVDHSLKEHKSGETSYCPTTSPAPVQCDMQVDNVNRSSNSRSSSSDSGSPSSDSDDDSSSASGSDAVHSPKNCLDS
ncbi:hypothetical protein DM860_015098 [Cuscuta australis]|uniref:Bromo domain-containing protein n=1 Tax=Cuscuta australis TaxID=267555 RepID=A0A328DTL9_9ASTE|nr:hypothetical protein DM860_015098 [Cuscuta australis]